MALVTNSYEPQNVQRPMSNVQCPTSRLVIGHSTLDICLSYGEGGIRTPDRGISPYNGLANRRLQPLGHLSSNCTAGILPASRHRRSEERRVGKECTSRWSLQH